MCHLGREVVLLTELQTLGILGSDITGTIPTEVGLLTKLTNLGMVENRLTGTLPSELGALTRLDSLSFYSNLLSGTIPAEVCALEVSCVKACAGLDRSELISNTNDLVISCL
jgi:Leucine-rich repeat (LRR) protein